MEHRLDTSSLPSPMPVRHKSGAGCVVQVLGALALGVAVLMGIMAVFTPWGFYMGGHFHIIPNWTGWGQMHSKIAGDYALFVNFSPKTGRGHRSPGQDGASIRQQLLSLQRQHGPVT